MQTFRFSLKFAALVAAATLLSAEASAQAQSCKDEEGSDAARTYVDQCLEVSPATRPPCNADNPCQLIWDETTRGCQMLGNDAPDFCGDYL